MVVFVLVCVGSGLGCIALSWGIGFRLGWFDIIGISPQLFSRVVHNFSNCSISSFVGLSDKLSGLLFGLLILHQFMSYVASDDRKQQPSQQFVLGGSLLPIFEDCSSTSRQTEYLPEIIQYPPIHRKSVKHKIPACKNSLSQATSHNMAYFFYASAACSCSVRIQPCNNFLHRLKQFS
jgi:hypothetical protein